MSIKRIKKKYKATPDIKKLIAEENAERRAKRKAKRKAPVKTKVGKTLSSEPTAKPVIKEEKKSIPVAEVIEPKKEEKKETHFYASLKRKDYKKLKTLLTELEKESTYARISFEDNMMTVSALEDRGSGAYMISVPTKDLEIENGKSSSFVYDLRKFRLVLNVFNQNKKELVEIGSLNDGTIKMSSLDGLMLYRLHPEKGATADDYRWDERHNKERFIQVLSKKEDLALVPIKPFTEKHTDDFVINNYEYEGKFLNSYNRMINECDKAYQHKTGIMIFTGKTKEGIEINLALANIAPPKE